ncbi:hypothetical protein EMIHUDRAFT_109323 [Emiliania huxleyi CCMP1516]|uniref:F-box domain-containing protein n=2 Tax=Emiliania huxleyi TaxID=2903 RepID=A0A0D3KSB9_EMIH1|nr:hypothetical protein EMIHUDRAFT_109323 [Emiliania huxleyi CCMP1516]EOD38654.1 hypothetical protein EMIHUDRAFT_109323 [Emiliania huxleyi CCMP1516]|eukprot:XP_005791083.1 hypothetical protein EMIHUDRAFT_109323 [Emiliania huxleyi CCMP1516]
MESPPRARTDDDDAPPTDWLGELPPELHLRILEGVDDFSDCAALSLASPRLGLLALRSGLARFKDPLFAVAMRLLLIERLIAGYHFPWLARVSPARCLSSEVTGAGVSRAEYWRLRRGEKNGANLRRRLLQSGQVQHYEGERGAERMVRLVLPSNVVHYEGEQDAERVVRREFADGTVQHFEGEQGAERVVRREFADGTVQHFEGERGAERVVRMERANGAVQHFEGEQGAERTVRMETASGIVQYYEGERGAERVVRMEFPAATCSTTRESEMGSGWCASTPPRV